MARHLYTLFYYLITPLIVLRLLMRARKAPAYKQRIKERFGFFPAPAFKKSIWLHSVSVGETIAAAPLVKALQQRYPDHQLVVTTMTPTGSERVRALFGDSVFHVYAPYDQPCSLARFIQRVNPQLLIIMETELWPNMVNACYQRSIPVMLANGRLSAKSAAGYQRFAALTKPMLAQLTEIAAQTQAHAQRFNALGADSETVSVTGSIKFDIAVTEAQQALAATERERWTGDGQRFIWVAASTHQGEDEKILAAHKRLLQQVPQALLLLVPRHPERFDQVAELARQQGFNLARRSQNESPDTTTAVYLGDTMGEMMLLLGACDVAFVGGSFIASGGHNMLEPAAWGLPVITGASDFNFPEASELLQQAGAMVKVETEQALADQLLRLQDQNLRQQRGAAALEVVAANRGSLERQLAMVAGLLKTD